MADEITSSTKSGPVPLQDLLSAKRDDIVRIACQHGARRVQLFGSVARGQGGQDSDIDLLLTLEPGTSLLDLVAIKQDIEDLLARRVDVVTESSLSPYIRDAVLRDAIDL